jgi:hypothetical protein
MMFKNIFAATVASFLAVSAGHATTITNVNAPGSYALVDLTNSLDLPTGAAWVSAGTPTVQTGSLVNEYRSPLQGAGGTLEEDTPYWNVLGRETGILDFDGTHTSLSLLWGSVDTYNTIEFWLGGSLVTSVISTLLAPAPVPGNSGGASFVTVSNLTFDEVRFVSNSNSFEFLGVSAAVPLPAGGLLLIGAIGGLAALRRRKTV